MIELLKQSCRDATQRLKDQWISECCDIVNNNREAIEHWMPSQQVCSVTFLPSLKLLKFWLAVEQ